MSLIKIQGVTKNYKLERTQAPALFEVSLILGPGERVCLMGPSGSGKSTLLNLIGGIDQPDQGQVLVSGQDLGKMSDSKLSDFRNRTLGFIFQSFNLIPVLSVAENVEYPLLLQNVSAKERRARVEDLLGLVGLFEMRHRSPENLSGGQRQRVAIARALVTRPKILLADEPTAALDHKTGKTILDLMTELNSQLGTTLVFSTHDPAVASYAQRTIRMLDGRISEDTGA